MNNGNRYNHYSDVFRNAIREKFGMEPEDLIDSNTESQFKNDEMGNLNGRKRNIDIPPCPQCFLEQRGFSNNHEHRCGKRTEERRFTMDEVNKMSIQFATNIARDGWVMFAEKGSEVLFINNEEEDEPRYATEMELFNMYKEKLNPNETFIQRMGRFRRSNPFMP